LHIPWAGTGKTVTLAAIALELLLAERTVLIAANTNIAVDNAVMKLCELCKKSQAHDFLSQGKVVRYGAVEKEELKTSSDYEDVYLPKIARRLGQEHDQQCRALEQVIAQIDTNLSSLKQNFQQREQEFRTAQAEIDTPLKALQQELVPLQQSENQRISKLHADKERYLRAQEEKKKKTSRSWASHCSVQCAN
jgi:hypothetical protein